MTSNKDTSKQAANSNVPNSAQANLAREQPVAQPEPGQPNIRAVIASIGMAAEKVWQP